MKLKSVPALFNKNMLIWDGTSVDFNSAGICEVKDNIGEMMLEKYPSMVFDENFVKEIPKTREQEFTQVYAEQLLREVESVKDQLKEKSSALVAMTADKDAWADKVAELVAGKTFAEEQLVKEKESFTNQIKTYELRIALMKTSVAGLKKTCETAGFTVKEWDVLTQSQLVDYILSKS